MNGVYHEHDFARTQKVVSCRRTGAIPWDPKWVPIRRGAPLRTGFLVVMQPVDCFSERSPKGLPDEIDPVLSRVSLYEMVVPWEEAELATRGFREIGFLAQSWWEQATNVLPMTDLNGTEDGQWCAEQFELAWRRANN